MSLFVVNPGLHTTIQDLGRRGYREWGIPYDGAFDQWSAGLANALLGNSEECALLEMTLVGGMYRACVPLAIALAGAAMQTTLVAMDGESRRLDVPLCCQLREGETLRIEGTASGARTYLAARGGWQTPIVLGSRSRETPVKAGDTIPAEPSHTPTRHPARAWMDVRPLAPIRVVDGPDSSEAANLDEWLGSSFRVAMDSDRMGLRLEGPPPVLGSFPNRLSAPIAPGALQVAGGSTLLLGASGGTMGGYPTVAYAISADIDRLAQLRPGDSIQFTKVTVKEARRLDRADRRERRRRLLCLRSLADDRLGSG